MKTLARSCDHYHCIQMETFLAGSACLYSHIHTVAEKLVLFIDDSTETDTNGCVE